MSEHSGQFEENPAAVRAQLLERLDVFSREYAAAGRDRRSGLAERMRETADEIRTLVRENSAARLLGMIESGGEAEPAHAVLEAAGVHPEQGLQMRTFVDGPRHSDGRLMTVGELRSGGDANTACLSLLRQQLHSLFATHSPRRQTITEAHGRLLGGEILREMRAFTETFQKHLDQE